MRRSLSPKMRAALAGLAIGSIGYLAVGAVIVNYDSGAGKQTTSSLMVLILLAIMALTTSNPRALTYKK